MQASKYIKALEEQITEAEKLLDRLRIKLEIAREVVVELDKGNEAIQAELLPAVRVPPAIEVPGINGNYHGFFASDAILRFLADHGLSPRKTLLDALEGQIKTKSTKPRNIVRNCLSQLAEKGEVEIDSSGNVFLKQQG